MCLHALFFFTFSLSFGVVVCTYVMQVKRCGESRKDKSEANGSLVTEAMVKIDLIFC